MISPYLSGKPDWFFHPAGGRAGATEMMFIATLVSSFQIKPRQSHRWRIVFSVW